MWWCAGSWAAAFCIHGSSSPGHQTWSWGWYSPCSALQDRQQTSSCSPGSWGHSDECDQKQAGKNRTIIFYLSFAILSSHLFDFGNISNEGVIVHKVQKLLQLVQVTDVVLANSLINMIRTILFDRHAVISSVNKFIMSKHPHSVQWFWM